MLDGLNVLVSERGGAWHRDSKNITVMLHPLQSCTRHTTVSVLLEVFLQDGHKPADFIPVQPLPLPSAQMKRYLKQRECIFSQIVLTNFHRTDYYTTKALKGSDS